MFSSDTGKPLNPQSPIAPNRGPLDTYLGLETERVHRQYRNNSQLETQVLTPGHWSGPLSRSTGQKGEEKSPIML